MDTRVLYVVAILIAALSGGYYYFSGKGKRLEVNSGRNMTYSAKGIHLTQTDEQGNLYVKAKVDRLEQDMQQKRQGLIIWMLLCMRTGQLMPLSLHVRPIALMTMKNCLIAGCSGYPFRRTGAYGVSYR